MDKDQFDASIGLAFSLNLFERYRKSGLLQAEMRHVPGIHGRCMGYIQLIEGKVTSCYVETKKGEQQLIALSTLTTVDNEKGPFEWKLLPPTPPQPPPPSSSRPDAPPRREGSVSIPRRVALLDTAHLQGWTNQHKLMLTTVYFLIDGQKSIEDIKREARLQSEITEEALHVLLALKVIILM